jgi:hypothetical protein
MSHLHLKKSSESVPFFNFGPNVLASFLKLPIIFFILRLSLNKFIKIIFE